MGRSTCQLGCSSTCGRAAKYALYFLRLTEPFIAYTMRGDSLVMSETLTQRSLLFESGSVFPGNVPLLGHLPTFLSALWRAKGNVSGAFESLFRQAQQKTFR
jgi:hypothetical protein